MFRTESTSELTKPSIKHSGHKMPATPLAPPDFPASGSIEVNIFGMRQMNNETNTVKAQMNFRSVGTLRRMKYLNKQSKNKQLKKRKPVAHESCLLSKNSLVIFTREQKRLKRRRTVGELNYANGHE